MFFTFKKKTAKPVHGKSVDYFYFKWVWDSTSSWETFSE